MHTNSEEICSSSGSKVWPAWTLTKSCPKHTGQEGSPRYIAYYNSVEPFFQRSTKLSFWKQCPNCRLPVSLARTPQKAKTKTSYSSQMNTIKVTLMYNVYEQNKMGMFVRQVGWASATSALFSKTEKQPQGTNTTAPHRHVVTRQKRTGKEHQNRQGL